MKIFTRLVLLFSLMALPFSFYVALKSAEIEEGGRVTFAIMTFIGCGILAIQSAIAMLNEPKKEI
jgi:hypothetical protein